MGKCTLSRYRSRTLAALAAAGALVWANARRRQAMEAVAGEDGRALARLLPTFDVTTVCHAMVDAPPDTVYAATREVDFGRIRSPLVHLLAALRMAPDRLARRLRGQPPAGTTGDHITRKDLEAWGWIPLVDDPGRELAMGLVGQFWRPKIRVVRLAPADFAAFNLPGYAKLVADFAMQPQGRSRTLLTYEARTATTDTASRRKFGLYWLLIGWGTSHLMRAGMALIKEDAERRHAARTAAAAAA